MVSFGASDVVAMAIGWTADSFSRDFFAGSLGLFYMMLLAHPLKMHRGEIGVDTAHAVGWLATHALMSLGPIFLVPGALFLGYEIGSVWCWQASTMLLLQLFEPCVLTFLIQRREGGLSLLSSAIAAGPRIVVRTIRATQPEPPPSEPDSFVGASEWGGARPGFVFKCGYHGVGYYLDGGPFRSISPAEEELTIRQLRSPKNWLDAYTAAESLVDKREREAEAAGGGAQLDRHWQVLAGMVVRMRYL